MMLMPGWAERLEQVEIEPPRDRGRDLPRNPDCFRVKTTFVDTIYGADDLLVLAGQLPLSHIGIDTEFRYDRPGFRLDAKTTIHDVRSVRPLLLSLTLVEVAEERQQLYTFAVDLRLSDVVEAIAPLFQLPVPFVGHYLQVEWFCLWQLGIEPPRQVWDTFIAEKARYLGLDHKSNHQKSNANEIEEIRAKEAAEEAALCRLDLVTSCRRYGIDYRMAANKKRLQQSFLDHALGSPFSAEQIAYAAEDAIAAASLYLPQVMAAAQAGLLNHLLTIEMPWVVTNARMNWTGLRVDAQKGQLAKQAAQTRADALRQALQSMGLANVNSHPQLQSFFEGLGLLQHFARDGKVSFDRERLKANQHLHPAIAMIRDLRKMDEWQKMQLLNSGFVGADGRVHPAYRHLGAATGRQTCNHPNVLALSAVQRNLIIPDEGNGIGEVDLSQIEPGIAGVVYRDSHLIDLFNTGDVYSPMAQQF